MLFTLGKRWDWEYEVGAGRSWNLPGLFLCCSVIQGTPEQMLSDPEQDCQGPDNIPAKAPICGDSSHPVRDPKFQEKASLPLVAVGPTSLKHSTQVLLHPKSRREEVRECQDPQGA